MHTTALHEELLEPGLVIPVLLPVFPAWTAATACPRAGGAVRARCPDCPAGAPLLLAWVVLPVRVGQLVAICPVSPHL
jgi:hypothetical protein